MFSRSSVEVRFLDRISTSVAVIQLADMPIQIIKQGRCYDLTESAAYMQALVADTEQFKSTKLLPIVNIRAITHKKTYKSCIENKSWQREYRSLSGRSRREIGL